MDIDLKTAWKAAKPVALVISVLLLIQHILVNFLDIRLGLPFYVFYLIYFIVFLFTGFRTTKELKGSLLTAGLAGSVCALAIGLFQTVLLSVGSLFVVQTKPPDNLPELAELLGWGQTETGLLVVVLIAAIMLIITVISLVVNFVTGIIGGFIGQKLR